MIILRLALTLLSTTTLSSGNVNPPTPWTPADLGAALALWFDASDSGTITLNGSTVSQWRDKSGNARHVSQSTASVQPAYLANDLNGKAGIDFYLAKGLNTSTSNPVVGFVVSVIKARNATWDSYHAMLDSYGSSAQRIGGMRASGGNGFWIDPSPSATWDDGVARAPSTSGYNSITSPRIIGFTVTSGRGNPMTGITIGNFSTVTQGGSGVQYEIIATSTNPSTEDRQKLEGYLAWKWGLQANLPISHPYRWDGTLFGYSRLWTPADATTALWLDASDASTITLNGSTVSQWRDKSGNARHAAQATAASQPTYLTGGINNVASVSFIDSDSLLAPPVFASATNATVICALQYNSLNASQSIYSTETGTGGTPAMYLQANAGAVRVYGGAYVDGGTYTVGQIEVNAFSRGASTGNLWRNGTQVLTDGAIGATTSNLGFLLGRLTNGLYGVYEMGEVVALNGQASTTDRQKLEGYLAWKWGTVANLPSNHPYKNGAPTV